MTIKQIEELTGMTRANIRYYESEALICPRRNPENGYRDYSQEDVQTLLKIKLLRCLDVSIEEVKAIQSGGQTMEEVLRHCLTTQEAKQMQLRKAGDLTRKLLAEGTQYDTLNAALYLELLESEESWQRDEFPAQGHPWKRYGARSLDAMLYTAMTIPVLWNLTESKTMIVLVSYCLMLLLEPLQLHFFGTTIGKAILGLRVTDLEERHLSYSAGLERTWTVIWEGEGLRIPFVEYYFLYKSYKLCDEGDYLPWEWDSEVTCKDDKLWR